MIKTDRNLVGIICRYRSSGGDSIVSSTWIQRLVIQVSLSMLKLIPTTHAPENIFSGASFWYVRHANLGTDSPGTVLYQITVPIRILHYSEPETCMQMTEMMIYHRLLCIFVISCKYGAPCTSRAFSVRSSD